MPIKYKRILLKLSGESLMGDGNTPIQSKILDEYTNQIKEIVEMGVEVGIVIGGGNIFRGMKGIGDGVDRTTGDYMGMLATAINSLAIRSGLENKGIQAKVLSAIRMEPATDFYSRQKAIECLTKKEVVIFAAGTGNPFFTTDTAATLRAVEINADVILKGTRVDGVYTSDPEKDKTAKKYDQLSFDEAYEKNLKIMDLTAFAMCKDNQLPIIVFNMNTLGNLKKVISGEKIGTIVS